MTLESDKTSHDVPTVLWLYTVPFYDYTLFNAELRSQKGWIIRLFVTIEEQVLEQTSGIHLV